MRTKPDMKVANVDQNKTVSSATANAGLRIRTAVKAGVAMNFTKICY